MYLPVIIGCGDFAACGSRGEVEPQPFCGDTPRDGKIQLSEASEHFVLDASQCILAFS